MTRLRFEAEAITPLVIAGAENKNPNVLTEGLRPPSLRGAMRWWFRAMMGGIAGAHDNYKTLRDLEGQIFGATDQGSSVRFRTYPLNGVRPDKAYLCMNDQQGKTRTGIPRASISRQSIFPPSKFRLDIQSDEQVLPAVLGSLWLLAMLGGLGNRSRRGFGSLTLSPKDDTVKAIQHLGLEFSYPAKPLVGIAIHLENGLKQVHGFFSRYAQATGSTPSAKFFVLSKAHAKLWLVKPQNRFWTSWQEAMNKLRDDIYRPCKAHLRLHSIGSANPSFASPLIIQIKRTIANQYFGVLSAFDHSWYRQQFWSSWPQLDAFLKSLSNYEHQEVALP